MFHIPVDFQIPVRYVTILRELATIYDVPRSTLSNHASRGGKTQLQAHEDYQTPMYPWDREGPKGVDNTWDEYGFPARLDLFKVVVAQLVVMHRRKKPLH